MKPKTIKRDPKILIKKKYQPPQKVKPEHKEFLTNIGVASKAIREEKDISISHLSTGIENFEK